MRLRHALALLLTLGCMAKQYSRSDFDEVFDNPPAAESEALCAAYNYRAPNREVRFFEAVRREIEKRGLVKADEWPLIDNRDVRAGMTTYAVIAAWGAPLERHEFATGRDEWIYRANAPRGYVTHRVVSAAGVVEGVTVTYSDPDAVRETPPAFFPGPETD